MNRLETKHKHAIVRQVIKNIEILLVQNSAKCKLFIWYKQFSILYTVLVCISLHFEGCNY